MTDPSLAAQIIREALVRAPLGEAYADEQRDLQPHIQNVLDVALGEAFGRETFRTAISVGGTGKPNVRLLGTNFWPDVEVSTATGRVAAIEVKLIRSRQGASKAIAEAIGQAVIYSIRYPHVFAFVAHYGRSDDKCHDEDAALKKRLVPFNIELILRRVGPHAV